MNSHCHMWRVFAIVTAFKIIDTCLPLTPKLIPGKNNDDDEQGDGPNDRSNGEGADRAANPYECADQSNDDDQLQSQRFFIGLIHIRLDIYGLIPEFYVFVVGVVIDDAQ